MQRIQPRHIILPAILASALLIFSVSRSVYGFTRVPPAKQNFDQLAQKGKVSINESFPIGIIQWHTEIMEASKAYGLDPNLLASVMLMESGGQPEVISRSGAVGLLQIMPKDGIAAGFTCVNGPCFQDRPSTSELINPRFNIQYGAKILSQLIKRNGSLRAALYAYGPMDVGFTYADSVLAIYESH